jgi:hypothetical protein
VFAAHAIRLRLLQEVPMMWIAGPVIAMVVLFLAQGFLVQVSVALTGEPAPRYGRATLTWILASILGSITWFGFSFTLGWMVPSLVSGAISTLLMIGVAAIVFKRQFGTSLVQGLAVSLIYTVLAAVLSGATWYLLGW